MSSVVRPITSVAEQPPTRSASQTALPQSSGGDKKVTVPSAAVPETEIAGAASPSPLEPSAAGDLSAYGTLVSDVLGSSVGPRVTANGGLSEMRERARQIQAQLGGQPLPITNHSSRPVLKLFGG